MEKKVWDKLRLDKDAWAQHQPEKWMLIQKTIKSTVEEVIKLIEEDIDYQQKQLRNDFLRDKSINWRIAGMKGLKQKLEVQKR